MSAEVIGPHRYFAAADQTRHQTAKIPSLTYTKLPLRTSDNTAAGASQEKI